MRQFADMYFSIFSSFIHLSSFICLSSSPSLSLLFSISRHLHQYLFSSLSLFISVSVSVSFLLCLCDASTELLQRLHGFMREHNVDFIGGDFNMSAFSTVGDVFTDAEFSAPGNSLGLGALEEPNRECAGFLIMPKRPYEWRVHSHGCYKFDNALLGLGPRDQSAHLPVFLHLRTTDLPGPSSVMRSEQAQQRRFERRHNKERMQRRRS